MPRPLEPRPASRSRAANMITMCRPKASIVLATAVLLPGFAIAGCGNPSEDRSSIVVRDTLTDGTVIVRYPSLPHGEPLLLTDDLRIGSVDGDLEAAFGDVRGVATGGDGTIYVLDYQASEVRAFGAAGEFLRTVATRGEGPGEISEANGLLMSGDSLLWIQDHGKWMILGLTPDGEESARVPMPNRSYGYMWLGSLDDRGRIWNAVSHSDEEFRGPPEPGMHEGTTRLYLKSFDPTDGQIDSVRVGTGTYRSVVAQRGDRGYSVRSVPHIASDAAVVDPAGGFWQTNTAAYRLARLDAAGDTVFVVEADVEPLPVGADDRTQYIETGLESSPDDRAILEEVAALMPEVKPVINRLAVDDLGRLWVGREVPSHEPPLYDVFDREGVYLASARFDFHPNQYFPLRFRDGHLYALVQDALDIPFIVRVPVPSMEHPELIP